MTKLDEYVAILNEKGKNNPQTIKFPNMVTTFTVEKGTKYAKIVQQQTGGMHRSVHSFVNLATDHVYKAAGWKAPAKGVRFDLQTDMEKIREVADIHGSYLYR